MNIVLLTAITFTLAPVCGGQIVFDGNSMDWSDLASPLLQPCQGRGSMAKYTAFVNRHILQASFDRNSIQQWRSYLQGKRLCGRAPVQTFIDARVGAVHQICSRSGLRVQSSPGNLCISRSRMQVFDVISDQNCSMNRMRVQKGSQKVIVACDKVNNRCLPVHFEKNRGQSPTNTPCTP